VPNGLSIHKWQQGYKVLSIYADGNDSCALYEFSIQSKKKKNVLKKDIACWGENSLYFNNNKVVNIRDDVSFSYSMGNKW